MRALSNEELERVHAKLRVYMRDRFDEFTEFTRGMRFCLHKNRVFLVRKEVFGLASLIPRKNLVSLGTHLGKITKKGAFSLQITALDYLARFTPGQVWLALKSEGSFLYGNNVLKAHIAKITENVPRNGGVIVNSPMGYALGFGVASKTTEELHASEPTVNAVFNIADAGLYIREEQQMFGLTGTREWEDAV